MFLCFMFLLLVTLLLSAQCNVSNLTKCPNGEVTLCKSKSLTQSFSYQYYSNYKTYLLILIENVEHGTTVPSPVDRRLGY